MGVKHIWDRIRTHGMQKSAATEPTENFIMRVILGLQ
jgi:hypothetical protein